MLTEEVVRLHAAKFHSSYISERIQKWPELSDEEKDKTVEYLRDFLALVDRIVEARLAVIEGEGG